MVDLPIDLLRGDVPRHAEHVGDEPEKLPTGELVVECGLVGHVAGVQVGAACLLRQIMPADTHGTAGGPQQPHQHLDGCGLARPVGPQEREEFAPGDRQTQICDGGLGPVGAGDMVELDHGFS